MSCLQSQTDSASRPAANVGVPQARAAPTSPIPTHDQNRPRTTRSRPARAAGSATARGARRRSSGSGTRATTVRLRETPAPVAHSALPTVHASAPSDEREREQRALATEDVERRGEQHERSRRRRATAPAAVAPAIAATPPRPADERPEIRPATADRDGALERDHDAEEAADHQRPVQRALPSPRSSGTRPAEPREARADADEEREEAEDQQRQRGTTASRVRRAARSRIGLSSDVRSLRAKGADGRLPAEVLARDAGHLVRRPRRVPDQPDVDASCSPGTIAAIAVAGLRRRSCRPSGRRRWSSSGRRATAPGADLDRDRRGRDRRCSSPPRDRRPAAALRARRRRRASWSCGTLGLISRPARRRGAATARSRRRRGSPAARGRAARRSSRRARRAARRDWRTAATAARGRCRDARTPGSTPIVSMTAVGSVRPKSPRSTRAIR